LKNLAPPELKAIVQEMTKKGYPVDVDINMNTAKLIEALDRCYATEFW
jgi:hypothetical protein